jgi:WD40 repeat protein
LEGVIQRHQDRVVNLALDSSGQHVAIGGLDGTVEIALVDGMIPITIRDSFHVVNEVAYHPAGNGVAIAGIGVEIWTFTANEGEDMQRLVTSSPTSAVAYSHDGKMIAAAAGDLVTVWEETKDGQYEQVYVLNRHRAEVVTHAFQPNGSLLATGSLDGTVRLWDMASGEEVGRLTGDFPEAVPAAIFDVIFSADGSIVIAGAGGHRQSEGVIWMWDVASGDLVQTLEGHQGGVYGVAMSAEGSLLASASWDGTVRVWWVDE